MYETTTASEKKEVICMSQVTTTIRINSKDREEAKQRGIKFSYVWARGWEAINEETGMQQTVKDQEAKILRMARIMQAQQRSIDDLYKVEP